MKTILSKRIGLLTILLPCALALGTTVHTEANKLVIKSDDSAQNRQYAAMEKEQWNDTHSLHQRMNKRAEKGWDKADAAFDSRGRCEQNTNINAYWESNTLRCLDRRTGHVIAP